MRGFRSDRRPGRRPVSARLAWFALLGLLAAPVVAIAQTLPVAALTTITVDNNADTLTPGTLRTAITTANSTADDVEIDVTPGLSPIMLATGLPDYTGDGGTHSLTVKGNGVTIDNAGIQAFSSSSNGTLAIDGVTISGGPGDAITITSGTGALNLSNSTITGVGNTAIDMDGDATVTNSTITGSTGVGLDTSGDVTVSGSIVSNNTSVGIEAGGDVTVTNSTVSGNQSTGISASGDVTVTGSTVSGNAQDGVSASGDVTVTNSTFSGNGGGIDASGDATLVYSDVVQSSGINVFVDGQLTSFGSVVTGAGGSADCSVDSSVSQGWNFADDTSCGFTGTGDTQGPGSNPALGGLANNGGPTETLLPQSGSPLIDAIPTAECQSGGAAGVTTDQRGITRPQQTGCDIGAVEVEVVAPTTPVTPVTPATPVAVQPAFTG